MDQTIDVATISLASHADVLKGSLRGPPHAFGTRDEPLRTSVCRQAWSAWKATTCLRADVSYYGRRLHAGKATTSPDYLQDIKKERYTSQNPSSHFDR